MNDRSTRESEAMFVAQNRFSSGRGIEKNIMNSPSRQSDFQSTPPQTGAWTKGLHRMGRAAVMTILMMGLIGCSALHPLKGIPARYVPDELQGERRSGKETIDLSRLRQPPPQEYLVDAGDVLGIYIEGVLGKRDEVPPVFFPVTGDVPPTLGFPIPIRDDGTLSLPLIDPIQVRGMTVRQVEDAIRRAYTVDRQILQVGRDRILISLQRPRTYQVLVLRQEAGAAIGGAGTNGLNLGTVKRGTGQVVALPAYRNDVLNALAQTGGLPGLDAENAIYVLRRQPSNELVPSELQLGRGRHGNVGVRQVSGSFPSPDPWGHSRPQLAQQNLPAPEYQDPGPSLPPWPVGAPQGNGAPLPGPQPGQQYLPPPQQQVPFGQVPSLTPRGTMPPSGERLPPPLNHPAPFPLPPALAAYAGSDSEIIRIPVRLGLGETADFRPDDVILHDGDIVFIESRETEIFYTGGLLGGGQYTLPRDYDLDVLAAISIAAGKAAGSGGGSGAGFASRIGGISALNQDITVSASDVVVLRQMPNGTQVSIKVDLNRALRNPSERVLIQPGDYIILQYKPLEAIAAFVERNILAGSLIGLATQTGGGGGGN